MRRIILMLMLGALMAVMMVVGSPGAALAADPGEEEVKATEETSDAAEKAEEEASKEAEEASKEDVQTEEFEEEDDFRRICEPDKPPEEQIGCKEPGEDIQPPIDAG
jgi:ABC-type glycerol-3-phosphate transport system substrate-binding protein